MYACMFAYAGCCFLTLQRCQVVGCISVALNTCSRTNSFAVAASSSLLPILSTMASNRSGRTDASKGRGRPGAQSSGRAAAAGGYQRWAAPRRTSTGMVWREVADPSQNAALLGGQTPRTGGGQTTPSVDVASRIAAHLIDR
jgi:hypothetical protein